jgi:hypothetical protein
VSFNGNWLGKWPGQWYGAHESGQVQPGEMVGLAILSLRASGQLTTAQDLDFTYLTTSEWAAAAVSDSVRRARMQAWKKLQQDIDDELVCVLTAAIL